MYLYIQNIKQNGRINNSIKSDPFLVFSTAAKKL